MNELCEIFDSIYAHCGNAVVIFDPVGNVMWINKNAEEFFKGNASESTVFAEIISKSADHGNLSCYFGGTFNKTTIMGTECLIAQLYGVSHIFELFSDSRISNLLVNSNADFRRELSSIASSCDEIKEAMLGTSSVEVNECLKIINQSCLNMSKQSMINTILCDSNQSENKSVICFRAYIEELAEGCRNVMHKGCTVSVGNMEDGYINADKNALNCFILELVKRLLSNVEFSKYDLNFSSIKKYDALRLTISVSSKNSAEKAMVSKSMLGLDDNILKLLAKTVDAKYSLYGGAINIVFDFSNNNDEPSMCSEFVTFADGTFSIYNVMLKGE